MRSRQGSDDVQVNFVKSSIWWQKLFRRRNIVALNLGALARQAGLHPVADLGVQLGPNEATSDELLRCPNASLGEVAGGIEKSASQWCRHERSVSQITVTPLGKTTSDSSKDVDEDWRWRAESSGLMTGDSLVVHYQRCGNDSVCVHVAEGVSKYVVNPLDMAEIGRELRIN